MEFDSPTTDRGAGPFDNFDSYDSQRYEDFSYQSSPIDTEKPPAEGYEDVYEDNFEVYENGGNVKDVNEEIFAPSPASEFPVNEDNSGFFTEQQSPVFGSANNAVLPPPEEMEPEEGHILREWKRQNALHLEEKEKQEREELEKIMDEADDYKRNFYMKRSAHVDAQKQNNRNKEQVFLSGQEHFHSTAEKHYWKAVSELIPTEIPAIETKRGRDKDKKKTTVIFNQGPKPGKPTDMARMRQILLKLKHNPPEHMKLAPPAPAKAEGEAEKTEKTDKNKAEPVVPSAAPVEVAA